MRYMQGDRIAQMVIAKYEAVEWTEDPSWQTRHAAPVASVLGSLGRASHFADFAVQPACERLSLAGVLVIWLRSVGHR